MLPQCQCAECQRLQSDFLDSMRAIPAEIDAADLGSAGASFAIDDSTLALRQLVADIEAANDEIVRLRDLLEASETLSRARHDVALSLAHRAVSLLLLECGKAWMPPERQLELALIKQALRDAGREI